MLVVVTVRRPILKAIGRCSERVDEATVYQQVYNLFRSDTCILFSSLVERTFVVAMDQYSSMSKNAPEEIGQ